MNSSLSQSAQNAQNSAENQASSKAQKIFDLQMIVELFQTCKLYFCDEIQNQYGPQKSNQKHREIENHQGNQSLHKKDCQILDQIENLSRAEISQFRFNDEQKQVVFEEGLHLCVSLIEKFENNHNYKKSRSIKRFLTKTLLFLNKFLIERMSKMMKENFDFLFFMTLEILIQNHSKPGDQNQKSKNSKKEPCKLYNFEIPLMITNKKIPFSFYFMFNLLQQRHLTGEQFIKKSKASEELNDYVVLVCEKISQDNTIQDSLSALIKTVCENFGCLELPISYLFYTSLLSIIQQKFSEKYESLNSQSLQYFRIEREIFSVKNLILMVETLTNQQQKSFKEIKVQANKIVFQSSFFQAEKFPCCLCSAVLQERITVSFIQNKSQNSKIKSDNQCKMKLTYCNDCYFDGQTSRIQDIDRKAIEQKNVNILTEIFLKSFWRQQFELEEIRKFRDMNVNLLCMQGKIPKLQNQIRTYIPQNDFKSIFNENETVFTCLRSLYSVENVQKKAKGIKAKNFISLKLCQQKLITLLLIMLNSKSELLRLHAIESVSKTNLVEYFSQFLTQSDILESIQKDQQNEDNTNKSDSSQLLNGKVFQLFNQIKNRIYDKSELIQTQSIKFLFTLQKFYQQNNLKMEIFQFVTSYYQEKIKLNSLKSIPLSVIGLFEEEINNVCANMNTQDKVSSIIIAKHMINIILTLIFSFFNSKNLAADNVKSEDQTRNIVLQVRRLIEKLLFLINEQEKQMKTVSINSQYQNLVISFLKRFNFNKRTINCFKMNDTILEKLIQLTQLGEEQQEPDDFNDEQKNMLLLSNLKLILQQLFQFNKQVEKSSVLSKSLQKKTTQKSKASKPKIQNENKHLETDSMLFTFSSKESTFNLNKIIKNILKREVKLTPLNCDILFLLIQKNILLNYESETNFSDTPSKVKRLILSLETIRRFNDIIKFLQNEIKECNSDFLQTYIKLYVSICIQINEEKKIQMLFNYYLNVFKYFKKNWLFQYETALQAYYQCSEQKQEVNKKNYNFFLRTLRTISIIATQFEKFKKIHNITQEYFSEIKNIKKNEKKYSIFTIQTQEAINSLQTEPQESFVKLYQEIYDILMYLMDHEILPDYMQLMNWSLHSLGLILNIHPHLFVKISKLFKEIPCKIEMEVTTINNYLKIFSSIILTGDSILMSLLSRSYENVKDSIWRQKQNASFQTYQNFQTFCQITFSLLKDDVISFLDVTPLIFYCVFVKNKKINDLAKNYLEQLNKKGNDGILFNNFQNTMINVSNKLQDTNKHFFISKEYFQNSQILGLINKDRQWNQRLYLQKDLKQIKIRSTIVKKIGEVLSNALDLKSVLNFSSYQCLILMLKIIENQKEMDVYELLQIVQIIEKVIRQNYLSIIRTYEGCNNTNKMQEKIQEKQVGDTQDEFDQQPQNLNKKLQKRKIMFVIGQLMYTLIKLTNEKKLKRFKKDLEKLIEAKRFNSMSINMKVNCINQKQIDTKNQNEGQSSYILNYGECLHFFKYTDYLSSLQDEQEIEQSLTDITKDFKILAIKMYNVLFQDEKPRIIKSSQPVNEIKKKQVKKNYSNYDSDEEYTQYSESEYTHRSVSRQNSLSKTSNNKETKRINTRTKPSTTNSTNPTKKVVRGGTKNLSSSLPKKLETRLSTINEEGNLQFEKQSRRSKRLMERESKKGKNHSQLR